jgi:hypothetical protein
MKRRWYNMLGRMLPLLMPLLNSNKMTDPDWSGSPPRREKPKEKRGGRTKAHQQRRTKKSISTKSKRKNRRG